MVKKAEVILLGYVAGITVAKKVPALSGPIGVALGLQLAPGKGVRLRPSTLLLLHAPQPIGVMPPHYYHLPDLIAQPLDLAEILSKPDARANLRKRIDADYAVRDAEQVLARQQSVRELTAYERQLFDDLANGKLPTPPTPQQLLGLDRLSRQERVLAALESGTLGLVNQAPGGELFAINPLTGQPVFLTADKKGGPAGFFEPSQSQLAAILGNGGVFADGFFAKNPADP